MNIGYKRLKSESRLELLRQLKDILTKTKLNNTSLLKSFFHQDDFDIELSIRQYLTVRILGLSFNKSILYSIGSNQSLSHPLPKEWRDTLESIIMFLLAGRYITASGIRVLPEEDLNPFCKT